MSKQAAWVVIGRFGRTHGIKGRILVHSFTEPKSNIMKYRNQWHIEKKGEFSPVDILSLQEQGNNLLAHIKGYEQENIAKMLTNTTIAVPGENLEKLPDGEYYWHDLVGMHVVNKEGLDFGVVTDVMATGSNDVLIVDGSKRHLVPYLLDQHVLSIDMDHQKIIVDWDFDF